MLNLFANTCCIFPSFRSHSDFRLIIVKQTPREQRGYFQHRFQGWRGSSVNIGHAYVTCLCKNPHPKIQSTETKNFL